MKEKIENMPVLVFLLVGVAFGGFNYMGSLSTTENLQMQISQLNTQLQDKKNGLTKAQNASAEIPAMKQEIERISQSLSRATELIPPTTSPSEVLAAVSRKAKAVGVRVPQASPKEAVPKNYYEELPVAVEFEGSYAQLTLFLYELSKDQLIVHPVDMDLTAKDISDRQTNLKMVGKVVGFKYKGGKL